MGIGVKPHFNTVSIPSRLLLHPLHLLLPGISKKNAARKPNKQLRLKIGDVKIHWCPTKMKHSTVLLGGDRRPHHSCVNLFGRAWSSAQLRPPHMAWPYKDLLHHHANDTKETFFLVLLFFSRSPGARESSTCFCLCSLMFTQKSPSHGSQHHKQVES